MLYLFHGTDRQKLREKVSSTVSSLLKREPNASHVLLNSESFKEDTLSEHLSEQGLFSQRVLVVLDHILEDKEQGKIFLDRIKEIASSENIFVLLEDKLDKKTVSKLEKHAEKTQTFNIKTSPYKRDTTIFKLTDALGARNRKQAWIQYQNALRSGARAEEIHGMIFWQTKSILLTSRKSTKGLKPFVVSKSKSFLNNWTEDEIKNLSFSLVSTYHNSRRGGPELEIGLEQLILSL